MSAPHAAPGWAALLQPYTLDASLTPLPGAAAPPSERTRRRLLDSPHMGDAEWAGVLLGVGEGWGTTDGEEK